MGCGRLGPRGTCRGGLGAWGAGLLPGGPARARGRGPAPTARGSGCGRRGGPRGSDPRIWGWGPSAGSTKDRGLAARVPVESWVSGAAGCSPGYHACPSQGSGPLCTDRSFLAHHPPLHLSCPVGPQSPGCDSCRGWVLTAGASLCTPLGPLSQWLTLVLVAHLEGRVALSGDPGLGLRLHPLIPCFCKAHRLRAIFIFQSNCLKIKRFFGT